MVADNNRSETPQVGLSLSSLRQSSLIDMLSITDKVGNSVAHWLAHNHPTLLVDILVDRGSNTAIKILKMKNQDNQTVATTLQTQHPDEYNRIHDYVKNKA